MNKILYNGQVIVDLDELADKYTKAEVDALVSSVFKYKGTVATKDDLNNIVDMKTGDCYNVEADGVNYAWNGEEWSALSGTVDLTNYYTKEQVDGKFGSYLPKNNTTEYTPTNDYNPATKKYVDDTASSLSESISEINAGSDTIYLPFEDGFRFWSESTEILSDDFNAEVTEYINSFKHYTTDIRVKTEDASGFFGVPVDIQFYNAGGLMTTKDGYVIIRDGDDTYAAMGNKTILQTANKKYYLANRVSDGSWEYDSSNVFTGSKEVYLIGNDRYLNAITYVLKLTLSFGEGTDIVCSESYLWKYKNGLTENFMLYGDNLNLTAAEDVCQDILDRYLTNPSIDQYIINEHIKNFYIKTRNRYVKGLTGYYNTIGVTDPANVIFENTDPTKLNSFALTNDGEYHITYNEDYVTGVYNDIDVTPGYDIDYTKLNKVIQKARPDNIDRPIPIVLTRTIGDRTVTYEVQATVGYVTTISTDGTKSKQLNLMFTVVDDGVVLRFYGSGAIDVNATALYNDLLTEDIHCFSEDYNG